MMRSVKEIISAHIFILDVIASLVPTPEKSVLVVDVNGHHPSGGGRWPGRRPPSQTLRKSPRAPEFTFRLNFNYVVELPCQAMALLKLITNICFFQVITVTSPKLWKNFDMIAMSHLMSRHYCISQTWSTGFVQSFCQYFWPPVFHISQHFEESFGIFVNISDDGNFWFLEH